MTDAAIPTYLTEQPRWMFWRTIQRTNAKTGEITYTKVPLAYRDPKKPCDAHDPRNWTDYAAIAAALTRAPGAWDGAGFDLGIVETLGEVVIGIDLDTCLDGDGALAIWAIDFLTITHSYAEVSPSGTGIKIIARVRLADLAEARRLLGIPEGDRDQARTITYGERANGQHAPGAQLFLMARYFAITGRHWVMSPEDVTLLTLEQIAKLAALFGPRAATGPRANGAHAAADAADDDDEAPDDVTLTAKLDAELARNAKLRERWDGGTEGLNDTTRSGRDMSIVALLRQAGFTKGEVYASLHRFKHGKVKEERPRYFGDMWRHTKAMPPPAPPIDRWPDDAEPQPAAEARPDISSSGASPQPTPAGEIPQLEPPPPPPEPDPAPKPEAPPHPPPPPGPQPRPSVSPIDLTVLRITRRPAPPLPLDVFGAHWGSWIRHAAEAACCPVDYVAAPLISLSSAAIGNARWAQGSRGWAEPPHLWLGSVGDSGDGKSPGADVLLGGVRAEIERRMIGDFPDRLHEWQAKAVQAKVRKELWEAEVSKALKTKKEPPPMPEDIDIGYEPQEPRLCCQDVTIERVATLLATAAPKGLLMVRDELAGFLLGMTAYSDAARPFWLESYGGRPYSVDRQKYAQQIRIRHNVVSWFGGIQPERLSEMMDEPDDGLFARFAWMWPEPIPFDLTDRAPDIEFAIRALDRLRLLEMIEINEKTEPLLVPLCPSARLRMVVFGRQMQRQKDLAAGLLRSAFGKARGLALRLSLVLELLWWSGFDGTEPPPKQISEGAFEAACHLVADYLIPMAERTYGDAACSQEDRNTAVLARWLKDASPRPTEVHVRVMQREVRLPGLTKAPDIHAACQSLVDAGWLLPAPKGLKVKGVLTAYPVNPALWAALA